MRFLEFAMKCGEHQAVKDGVNFFIHAISGYIDTLIYAEEESGGVIFAAFFDFARNEKQHLQVACILIDAKEHHIFDLLKLK